MSKYIYPQLRFKYQKLNKLAFCLMFVFCSINICSAQQFNNWIFHNNNGLNFNTNPPSFLSGGQIANTLSFYSTSTISDNFGKLLFYSDGARVWNKNHQLMPNGFGLFGDGGQINTVIIIPFLSDSSKYYLFTSKGLGYHIFNNEINNRYYYSIVDMSLNSGLGDVISKNNFIKNYANEKMCTALNANGSDVWWICRDWNNAFYSYNITCQGIQTNNPKISLVGQNINSDLQIIGGGDLKASPDGSKIAVCYTKYFEIYEFDNNTGILSNAIKIPTEYCYGMEFSPNSKLLYVSGLLNGPSIPAIAQYNLTNYDSLSIESSKTLVFNNFGLGIGALQLGPDGKIYCAGQTFNIGVIDNPNVAGVGCNFDNNFLVMPNTLDRRFPYSPPSLISSQNVQISYTVAPDCRTVNFTGKTYIKGNNLAFKWKFIPTDSITQNVVSGGDTTYTTTTFTFPPGIDSFNVQLFVTSDTVCGLGRAGKLVVVKPPPPKANFGFTNTCNNLNVVFTDSSLLNFNPSLTYVYAYKPALAPANAYVNFATIANTNFSFPSFDSFDVRLIVRSPLSCVQQDTIVKRIVLSPKPIAGFTYNNNCGSLNVAVTNNATIAAGNISSYQYFLNGIATSNNANYIFNVPNFGAYNLQQVVTSSVGCVSDTFSLPIIVKAKPIVVVTTLRDSVCQNTNYTLTANATVDASIIANYTWLKNNALIVNNTNIQTENNTTGIYTYKLVAQSATGCNSDTALKTITVASKPTATITATNICGSKQINIASTAFVTNDNINNYYIDFGDGNNNNNNPNNTTYTYANFGNYTLKFVVKGSAGCQSDTAFFNINVKDKPTATINYNNNACHNTNYTLTANATVNNSSITNYTWLKNNIIQVNNTNILTENNSANNYVYQLIVTAANGCQSDTATQLVTVQKYPTINFTATNGCANTPVVITNSSINNNSNIAIGLNYLWATNDGQTSTNLLPNFSFANAGTKTIFLKASTSNNCADSATNIITIEDKPITNFTINEACLGKIVNLSNNSTGSITNYLWATNNGQSSMATTPNFIFNNTGSYTINLTASTLNNCTDTKTETVNIQAVLLFTTPAVDTNAVVNQPIQLNISGAATYIWQPTTNLNSNNVNNPIFTTSTAGVYNYQIQGTTAQGCKGNATIKINVFAANNYIFIPNAFTPNADGLNDRLRITCTGLQKLNYFTIYNRWGNMVYNQNNCNQNGWDGKLKGVLQPNATFVYNWSGVDFLGKKVNGKGTVTLIR